MANKINCLRVFIASPGGLADDRKAFREEIQDYNQAESIPRGVLFHPVGWEDTLGAVGRPQAIINGDVRTSDYFILLLWNRWGSPPDTCSSRFTSGTEEEYEIAMECYNSKEFPMRQLVMIFKSVDAQQLSDPGPQLQKVLEFRQRIESQKTHLFNSFDTTESFRKLLRKHLATWLRDEEQGGTVQKRRPPDVGPLIIRNSVSIADQQVAKSSVRSLVANAWALADEGRLTEAEVEFARSVVGQSQPQPIIEFGRFLTRMGRLDQAKVMFEGAARVAEDQRDSLSVSIAYGNLGTVLGTQGDLRAAEQMFRKALEIDEKLGRLEGMAANYHNLGKVLLTRGDLDDAEKMFRKALEINEKLGRLDGMASNYLNLGNVLLTHGDLDDAEKMFRKALDIYEDLRRSDGMATSYGNLGNVIMTRGDLDGAEKMFRKALEIDEKLRRSESMANHYGNLGNVLMTSGDLDGAEKMFQKALEMNEKLGRLEGKAIQYGNLGNVLMTSGDLDGAEQMYRKALEIDEKLRRSVGMANQYGNLSDVLMTRGDLDGAEQMLRRSLEINEKLGRLAGIAGNYLTRGNVLRSRGDLDGAEQTFRKLLGIAEQLGSSQLIATIRSLLGTLPESPAENANDV
ncbi:MAG: tetratricopeptide repeat protein [Desulfomonilaceae bacterium]